MKQLRRSLLTFLLLQALWGCSRHLPSRHITSRQVGEPLAPPPASSGHTSPPSSAARIPRPIASHGLTASDCFPMAVKNRWLYQVTDSKKNHYDADYEIERTDKIGGRLFFVSRTTMSNQPNSFSRIYTTHTPFGLSTYRIITSQNSLSAIVEYGKVNRLPVNLPERVVPGKQWVSAVPAHLYSSRTTKPYRIRGRIYDIEKVHVPAGTFEALRVTTSIEYGGKESKTTVWYVPGVGQVKFLNTAGEWRHQYLLKAATINNQTIGKF